MRTACSTRVHSNGRDVWRSLRTTDARKARRRLKSALAAIRESPSAPAHDPLLLFEDAVVAWSETRLKSVAPSTQQRCLVNLRQLDRRFRGLPVASIGTAQIVGYVQVRLGEDLYVRTIKADMTPLRQILDIAVLKGWRESNPLPGVLKDLLHAPHLRPSDHRRVPPARPAGVLRRAGQGRSGLPGSLRRGDPPRGEALLARPPGLGGLECAALPGEPAAARRGVTGWRAQPCAVHARDLARGLPPARPHRPLAAR